MKVVQRSLVPARPSLIRLLETPLKKERYDGIRGKIQGEKNVNKPIKNAVP
jgi:hypothetical protein